MHQVSEALSILDSNILSTNETEYADTDASLNRILAEPVIAVEADPAFDNSAMDGYVFMKEDLDEGKRTFRISGAIRPEDEVLKPIEPGTCVYITTGSRIPPGGDFVIPVELTNANGDNTVIVTEIPIKNAIRKQGEGYRRGEVLLPAGKRIRPVDVGIIRQNAFDRVKVKRTLRIAVQATGNELDERRNTNTPVIANLFGSDPSLDIEIYPVIEDDKEMMEKRFAELLDKKDIIVTTGGISAGAYDLVIPVLETLGVEFLIRKVSQKPGKPFSYGKKNQVHMYCLPGNPVSAFFCAVFYVKRALKLLKGDTEGFTRSAVIQNRYECVKHRTEFVPGILAENGAEKVVTINVGIRSHLLHNLSAANCFVQMGPGVTCTPGNTVNVIPFYE
jgi:molybdopterin molybdotransferase